MKIFSVGLFIILWFSCTCFGGEGASEMVIDAGVPNDQETQVFFDGSRYRGQFRHGAAHGQGTIIFSDGSIYTGQFENGEISGQGTMVFPDGSEYVGQFKDGMIHGQGSITFSDGSIYEGPFVDNKYHGEGVWSSPYGIKYSGQFRAGKFDGQGTYTLPDGSRYVGIFKDDQFYDGTWDRTPGFDRLSEDAPAPALENEESGVETSPVEGYAPSRAYPEPPVPDRADAPERFMPEGTDPSVQTEPGHAFSVQVGAFISRNNAERLAAMLRGKGYTALILPMVDYYDRSWYAVRLGSYPSFEEAKKEATAFSEMEKLTATVRPVDTL